MMRLSILIVGLLFGAGMLPAQNTPDTHEDYTRVQRLLQQSRSEVDRLVDRRFRHDLGLPAESDPTMPRSAPVSTAEKERMLRELRQQDGQTASLLSRFNKLKRMVEALRVDAAARAAENVEEPFVVVPSQGTAQRPGRDRPVEAIDNNRGGISSPDTPAPLVEGRTQVSNALSAVHLGRVRGQIRGSEDHLRVAQSLFKAAQALMDAAEVSRTEGRAEAALELDNRAKSRLDRALAELEPLLDVPQPSYPVLFCKGRCLEMLFRYSVRYDGLSLRRSTKLFQQREQEVREPFLAISARDVQKSGARDELEVLGSWGTAANAAVEHFRWMNQHGSWAPKTPIENITWPGEKDR